MKHRKLSKLSKSALLCAGTLMLSSSGANAQADTSDQPLTLMAIYESPAGQMASSPMALLKQGPKAELRVCATGKVFDDLLEQARKGESSEDVKTYIDSACLKRFQPYNSNKSYIFGQNGKVKRIIVANTGASEYTNPQGELVVMADANTHTLDLDENDFGVDSSPIVSTFVRIEHTGLDNPQAQSSATTLVPVAVGRLPHDPIEK